MKLGKIVITLLSALTLAATVAPATFSFASTQDSSANVTASTATNIMTPAGFTVSLAISAGKCLFA